MEQEKDQDREGSNVVDAPQPRPGRSVWYQVEEGAAQQRHEESRSQAEPQKSEDRSEASPALDDVVEQVAQAEWHGDPAYDDMSPLAQPPSQIGEAVPIAQEEARDGGKHHRSREEAKRKQGS
jgi:hypothetical protein